MKNCKGKRGRRRNISRIRSEGRKREKKIPEGVANSLHSKSVQFSPFLVFEERRKKKGGKESRAYDDSFVAVLSNKLLRGVGEKKEKRKALHRPIVKQDRGQPGVGNPGSSEPGGRGNGNGRWPFFGEIQFRRGRRRPSPALKSVCVCVHILYAVRAERGEGEKKIQSRLRKLGRGGLVEGRRNGGRSGSQGSGNTRNWKFRYGAAVFIQRSSDYFRGGNSRGAGHLLRNQRENCITQNAFTSQRELSCLVGTTGQTDLIFFFLSLFLSFSFELTLVSRGETGRNFIDFNR